MPRQQKPIPFRFPGLRKSRESCISIGSCFLSNTDPLCWALCSYENEKHGPAAALRADTKGTAAKSHIPSIPAQQSTPRRLLAGAALSTVKGTPDEVPRPRRSSYLSRLRVQRDDVTQYRVPISAAGEGRTRHAPGTAHPRCVHLFHVFPFSVFSSYSLLLLSITARPVFAHDRQEKTDCHGQCDHWPRNDNEVRL